MKLNAEHAGIDHQLIIEFEDARTIAQLDECGYSLEIREIGRGEYLLTHGTAIYRCRIEANQERSGAYTVYVRSRSFDVKLTDIKRLSSTESSQDHGHGLERIVAPMPGKLVRVLAEVGAQVEAGEGLLVVEAMKMQNELKATRAGTVVSLRSDAGATVNAGDVLAVIE